MSLNLVKFLRSYKISNFFISLGILEFLQDLSKCFVISQNFRFWNFLTLFENFGKKILNFVWY